MSLSATTSDRDLWEPVAELSTALGLKGLYAGVSNGHVLLAGGSNFPRPPAQGGAKVAYRTAYVAPVAGPFDAWLEVPDALPRPLAEGVSITVPEGVLCLGGHDGEAPSAGVFLLTFDPATRAVSARSLPPLPVPLASTAAALLGDHVHVAGGAGADGATRAFWRMRWDGATAEGSTTHWESLPEWPAPARLGASLAAVDTPAGRRLLLAGGVRTPTHSEGDYLRDAWLYDPATGTWQPAAPMPRAAVLPAVVPLNGHCVAILGGSDGHDFDRMRQLGECYRIPDGIQVYDASTDRWTERGRMPVGLVAAGVARVPRGWILAGGEYSPGLRTRAVYCWRP